MKIRKAVGVFLKNNENEFLILRNARDIKEDGKVVSQIFEWDVPRGGVEKGENKTQALLRELKEEIGTDKVENIKKIEHVFYFDFPKDLAEEIGFKGQEVHLFSADFAGKYEDIIIDNDEVSGFMFLNPEEFLEKLSFETTKIAFKEFVGKG